MRICALPAIELTHTDDHSLYFSGEQGEHFQISILDHGLIRVQMRPDGEYRLAKTWAIVDSTGETPREGRSRDDYAPFPCPSYAHEQTDDNHITITTDTLQIALRLAEPRLTWSTVEDTEFAADTTTRAYAYDPDARDIYHLMRYGFDESYYGFGEKSGTLDKSLMRFEMRNMDALGYSAKHSDPLYKHWSFYITLNPEQDIAYGLFYDNLATATFDMGRERHVMNRFYRKYHAVDGDLDYYMIYGDSVADVVRHFSQLIGRMALPPRWSLGYLGSTMTYTEQPDAQEQLLSFIDQLDQHDIPCDFFHLSSGYSVNEGTGNRNVFHWNRDRIPEPDTLIQKFHDAGLRLAANIKPYLLTSHPRYDEVKALNGFVQDADEDTPALDYTWGGAIDSAVDGSHLDFTNPAVYEWWQDTATETLLSKGVDTLWNDNNEFALWDDEARCHGFGEETRFGLLRPLLGMLMVRASTEAQQAQHPDERPFVLTRAGVPGIQRYAQSWSGDNTTSWETLQYNIPMGLGLSLSGMPNTGHDVGGFFGDEPSPELLVRWVQNGIFHPRFCIHSLNNGILATEPWMYPKVLPLIRQAIQFRYQLIPYLYSLMYHTHTSGDPVIRPTLYHYQDDPDTHNQSFDFMLGSQMLVASVYREHATSREVYLPDGSMWCDSWGGHWFDGGHTITLDAPLERAPFLMVENGMLPLTTLDNPDARRVLLFPAPTRAENDFTLIEDDGVSLAYQSGEVTRLTMTLRTTEDRIELLLKREGDYDLPYDDITFRLPSFEKRPFTIYYGSQRLSTEEGDTDLVVPL